MEGLSRKINPLWNGVTRSRYTIFKIFQILNV